MKRMASVVTLATMLLCCVPVRAEQARVTPFKDGDRVVVIGDSITHGRNWHSYLALFYATRYPERTITWFNAGISGDTSAGALRRFDWDIAPHRPTVAMVMLGMNDVGRWLYGKKQVSEKLQQQRTRHIDDYATNMTLLMQKLKAIDCRIVLVTPSIYEQTAKLKSRNYHGVNDALGRMAERLREMAPRFGAEVVDVHGAMNRLNTRLQQDDPTFTLVGPDRVHPLDAGQMVMADAVIRAQGLTPVVSVVHLNAKADHPVKTERCTVTELTTGDASASFSCLAEALPMPVPKGAEPAFEWLTFNKTMNRQVLVVKNLAPGRYRVSIDETPVLESTAKQLADGLNLADIDKTPMYQQAVEVMKANHSRHWVWAGRLRTFALIRHGVLSKVDLDPTDFEVVNPYLEKTLEDPKLSSFSKKHIELYLKHKPNEDKWLAHLAKATALVNKHKTPVRRRWTIERID